MDAEKKRYTKLAWIICLYQVFGSYCLIINQNYGNYILTNVAGLKPAYAATAVSVSSIALVICSLLDGALVQNTRSRWGQFRPWYMFGVFVCLGGGYLCYIKTGNMFLTATLCSLSYFIPSETMNVLYTARQGMFTKMSAGNADARTMFGSYNWLGTYIGYFIAGWTTIKLVSILGKGNETAGFIGAHTVFGISCIIGYFIMVWAAKPYDLPNKDVAVVKEKRVNILDMFTSVFTNKAGRVILLSDIGRFTAYYFNMNLISYQCSYVFGDINTSATVFAVTNIGGLLGSYLAPVAAKIFGRKKTMRIFDILVLICYVLIIPFGGSLMGLTIVVTANMFFSAFTDGIDPVLYMDAGEYYLYHKKKDTRSYLNSMYNVAVKIGVGVAGIVTNAMLASFNYNADNFSLDAAGKAKFTMMFGLVATLLMLLPIIFMFFHPATDKEMQDMTEANYKEEKMQLTGKA